MNIIIMIGLPVVALALSGAVLIKSLSGSPEVVSPMGVSPNQEIVLGDSASVGGYIQPAEANTTTPIKVFTVEGESYSFMPNQITVNQGDRVKITFVNKDGFHDWVIDEFSAKTQTIPAGQSETIEFVADKAGTFEYYCSVGAHRVNGMVGKLIVQ